jgi:hypothetical protein
MELKPLSSLSKPGLMALVKLLMLGRMLCTSRPLPYRELVKAGYAYQVGMSPREGRYCFVLNGDLHQEDVLQALGMHT